MAKLVTEDLLLFELTLQTISFGNIAFADDDPDQLAVIVKNRRRGREQLAAKRFTCSRLT
jgi:hypothetical protein